jgi:hypothetical protein
MKRPKLDDRANAHHMTANELAVAAHISAHHIRKICREIGVRWLDTPQNPPLKAASPGFVPRPQKPDRRLPADHDEKIAELATRVQKGEELFSEADRPKRLRWGDWE